jgi:hypothetical protein
LDKLEDIPTDIEPQFVTADELAPSENRSLKVDTRARKK